MGPNVVLWKLIESFFDEFRLRSALKKIKNPRLVVCGGDGTVVSRKIPLTNFYLINNFDLELGAHYTRVNASKSYATSKN